MSFIPRIPGRLLLLIGILGSAVALGAILTSGSVTVMTAVVLLWSLFTVVVGTNRIVTDTVGQE